MFGKIQLFFSFHVIRIGLLSGILMAVFFGLIEWTMHINVYTLLMNVDYVPGFRTWDVPALLEFSLHMIVSIFVCAGVRIADSFNLLGTLPNSKILRTIGMMVAIGVFLFPTTLLTQTAPTPALDDWNAWTYWLIGHIGYGYFVGRFLK